MTVAKSEQGLLLQRPGAKPERVHLGDELNHGGAGSVYSIKEDSVRVVKLYHAATLASEGESYEEKIVCMLENVPDISDMSSGAGSIVQLAWPLAAAYSIKGDFIGFAMPIIDLRRTTELEYILSPKQAQRNGLAHNFGISVTLAFNLAAIVESIHAKRHAIVDLKPLNLKYYIHELNIAVLDCDGFHINIPGKVSEAPQVTPDYVAPEFQGGAITNSEHQDRFALAVIIFKLFNFDIHPYAGVPKNGANVPSEQAEKIKDGLYPYGIVPHKKVSPVPASVHEAFPAELRSMFDRAFGGSPSLRPRADEWVMSLKKFAEKSKGQLVSCLKKHLHFKDMPCATCLREEILAEASSQKPQHKIVARRANVGSQSGVTVQPVARHGASPASSTPSHQAIVQQVSPQQSSSQSAATNPPFWVNVVLMFLLPSLIAGFYIGPKFWLASAVVAFVIFFAMRASLGPGAKRLGGSLVVGVTGSGLIFLLIWIFGVFHDPSHEKDNVQKVNEKIAVPSQVKSESASLNDLLAALSKNELDIANGKLPMAIAEYSASPNVSNEFFNKLLTATLDLTRQNLKQNRMEDANKGLLLANEKLLNNQASSVQSSSSSKQAECQFFSLLADLYWSQKNYPQAINAARRAISNKFYASDMETDSAINDAHAVLSMALLMMGQSKEAASEFEAVHTDLLQGSTALYVRIMKLVAGTQANQYLDPDAEARKQLANYKDEEIRVALNSIKELSGGSSEALEVSRVAERLAAYSMNITQFNLANSLLMSGQRQMAVNAYQTVTVDLLPESDRLLARMMKLVADTQANLFSDPEKETRKQLAAYKDEEMIGVLKSIKEMAGERPESKDVLKVADRLVEAKIKGPSYFEKASTVLGELLKVDLNNSPSQTTSEVYKAKSGNQ